MSFPWNVVDPRRLLRTPSFVEEDEFAAGLPPPPQPEPPVASRPRLARPEGQSVPDSPVPLPVPKPAAARPRYTDPIKEHSVEYVASGLEKPGWKRVLTQAALGALQGGATGGGLGAALGGALGGGLGGAVAPKRALESQFRMLEMPRLLEEQQRQQQMAKQRREAEDQVMQQAMSDAQLRNIESQIKDRDLDREDIKNYRQQQLNKPRDPREGYIETPQGIFKIDKEQFIPGTAPQPKTLPPAWRQDARGNYINLNDPSLQGKTIQGPTPRGGRGSGGRGGGSASTGRLSSKNMNASRVDIAQFERIKAAAAQAGAEGDIEQYEALRTQMNAAAERIAALYGDGVEVGYGENEWPYVKYRQGGQSSAKQATKTTSSSKSSEKVATMQDVRDYAQSQNPPLSEQEAMRRFESSGYIVR